MKSYTKKPLYIKKAPEFSVWLNDQTFKSQAQIEERLDSILEEGYFGDFKSIDIDIFELRWKNGRRIYYAFIEEINLLLLIGGNKNGQDKDIRYAKRILKKYTQT